ncbi:MAG: NAD(P)-binding domain-containing protein [Xanthobacteraceae bacterium]|nr:NAD(P)-binding domain-containing protein [Xanthobacteraceae bacterium]
MTKPLASHDRRAFLRIGGAATLFSFLTPLAAFAQTASGGGMKIGVVGSGRLGGTVGGLWVKAGHQVMFSSRHPEELVRLVEGLGPKARAGTVEQAVAFGEVILIAVPYSALPQVGRDNAKGLAGKVVLDACNPVAARDGEIVKEADANGVGPTSAKYLPGTRLVRAFNSFGSGTFASESRRAGEPIGVPIAGDDPEAMKVAAKLVRDAGFEPVAVPLARAKEFSPSNGPLFRQALPVKELRQRLGITQ